MEVSLRQLQCLVAVADHGSVSAAAFALDVSQPSVSHQLQLLEDCLGHRLLDRHARGITIRAEGQVVVERARKILQDVQGLGEGLKEVGQIRGEVRLGIVPTASSHQFPQLYRRLQSRYPLVSLNISEDTSEQLVQGVRHGDLDLAIVTLPLPYSDVVIDPLWREELVLILPPQDSWGRDSATIDMIANQPYIGLSHGNGLQSRVLELFHRAGVQPKMAFVAKTTATVIGFVAAGNGVAIVPIEAARPHANAGTIKALPLSPPAHRQLVLAHRPESMLSAPARALAHFFVNHAKRIAQAAS